MLRIAITDDDERDAAQTQTQVESYCKQKGIECKIDRYTDGIFLLERYSGAYDLVFMDIEMGVMDGMETARRLRKIDRRVLLVFTTKMAQYAVYGYDVDAIGYLVKPIDYYSMALKMKKAVELLALRQEVSLVLTADGERRVVSSREILYVEVRGHEVFYHTADMVYRMWGSLKDCVQKLQDANFVSCSRYYLVNLEHIKAVQEDGLIVGETPLPLSRMKKKGLLEALTKFYGGGQR